MSISEIEALFGPPSVMVSGSYMTWNTPMICMIQHQEKHPRDRGQRDVPELAEHAGAVDHRRLIQLLDDALQARKVQNGGRAEALPRHHDDGARE